MTGVPSFDIAIHSAGQSLILPPEFDPDDIKRIVENKAQLLKTLRSEQMNASGFYTTLPGPLRSALQASSWVALKVETTAPTRFSAVGRVTANTRIGPDEWIAYRAVNPGASVNTRPRMRVLSLHTDELGDCVWDLDALTSEDRQQLSSAALENKIVISHNAGFDLGWLFTETAVRPSFVLDTMLLVRHLRPITLLRPFKMAAGGDADACAGAKALIERKRGEPSASLEWISTSLGMPIPDQRYQPHANWCVSPLSVAHHAYAATTARLPKRILQFL
jgi:hypothetical protein